MVGCTGELSDFLKPSQEWFDSLDIWYDASDPPSPDWERDDG